MKIKTFILFLIFTVINIVAYADAKNAYFVSGIVRDSISFEPLPFASVTVVDEASGALSNDNGIFELTVSDDAKALQVSCLGYDKKIIPIKKGMVNLYDVRLTPSTTVLNEVIVKRKKYSKKNNPAVDFARSLRKSQDLTDPERNPYFNYDKHELITVAINDFGTDGNNSKLLKKFPFLWEHVDTSEISGKPILNIMAKEKTSTHHYRNNPKSRKEIVEGLRREGVDEEFMDQSNTSAILEEVLRPIDLYDGDINILHNRFVSPLSRIAPDFYRFYLTDTVEIEGEKCIVLSFYPHNPASFGFNGQIFVPANDTTMFIKKATMRTPKHINLNYINNMFISQEFQRAPDGSRLKMRDDLTIEASVLPNQPGFYVRRNIAYANHNFDKPDDESIFDELATQIVDEKAEDRDEQFWEKARLFAVTENEKDVSGMVARLRSVPLFYWGEKVLKILVSGYVPTSKKSLFDYGPVNTSLSHNSLEGWRLRAGGMTTANLSKHWFGRGYTAYGLHDKKWKYGAEVEYSFNEKKYHSREFPIHSLRFTSRYDIDQIGQHYLFTNRDNIFISLKRMEDNMSTYLGLNQLEYTLELRNNFSVCAAIAREVQHATPYVTFVDGYGKSYDRYAETSFNIQLRYAPGETFYQAKSYRMPIDHDVPVFTLSHKIAPKNWFGSKFMINTTEASFSKRFWFSILGYADVVLKGGHVWSQSPYINLLIPNANLSYTIQPESFALMNAMEFINDSFVSLDLRYWLNGALLNFIPGVKKLKLREIVTFRGLWGSLSDKNNPDLHPELFKFPVNASITKMDKTPYMEVSAGLDNIFRCLRIDYVWRLTYLDVPYQIDRRGLRVALHFAF